MALSNEDQLMLELINRARANPQAEADRLIVNPPNSADLQNLNEGLPSGTISTVPKQPLAWNEDLIDAAAGHTQAMFDLDFFAHQNPVTNFFWQERAEEQGYTGVAGENLGEVFDDFPLDLTEFTPLSYENLFTDYDYQGRGHRVNFLDPKYEEIGISNVSGGDGNYTGGGYWDPAGYALLTTQNFGYASATNPFVTGVVYDDTITDDDFYTVGEGLGGITVQATDSAGRPAGTTSTISTGGYQLELAPDTYQVSFIGDLDGDSSTIETVTEEVVISSEAPQNVKVDVECFLTGTHILTERGEVAVENLKIGDRVRTAEGKLEPIKWIGKQTIQPDLVKSSLRGNPVLIKAGALGENLPVRDLYVSPCHSLLVEGLLIDAGALVNDRSIVYTQPSETFVYYHVELEHHALLVAEGTSAESYLPQKETREEYDNSEEYETLHPHGSNLMLWPMDYPRISSKTKVPQFISQKLMAIAGKDWSISA